MIIAPKISVKIKDIRVKNNLSQDRFGRKIGISGKSISAYETGRCHPPLYILEQISRTYDASFLHLKESRKVELENRLSLIRESLMELEEILNKGLPL